MSPPLRAGRRAGWRPGRYYERQGLLHPAREANGYRDFDEADVAAVLWIRRRVGAGLAASRDALDEVIGARGRLSAAS